MSGPDMFERYDEFCNAIHTLNSFRPTLYHPGKQKLNVIDVKVRYQEIDGMELTEVHVSGLTSFWLHGDMNWTRDPPENAVYPWRVQIEHNGIIFYDVVTDEEHDALFGVQEAQESDG